MKTEVISDLQDKKVTTTKRRGAGMTEMSEYVVIQLDSPMQAGKDLFANFKAGSDAEAEFRAKTEINDRFRGPMPEIKFRVLRVSEVGVVTRVHTEGLGNLHAPYSEGQDKNALHDSVRRRVEESMQP